MHIYIYVCVCVLCVCAVYICQVIMASIGMSDHHLASHNRWSIHESRLGCPTLPWIARHCHGSPVETYPDIFCWDRSWLLIIHDVSWCMMIYLLPCWPFKGGKAASPWWHASAGGLLGYQQALPTSTTGVADTDTATKALSCLLETVSSRTNNGTNNEKAKRRNVQM